MLNLSNSACLTHLDRTHLNRALSTHLNWTCLTYLNWAYLRYISFLLLKNSASFQQHATLCQTRTPPLPNSWFCHIEQLHVPVRRLGYPSDFAPGIAAYPSFPMKSGMRIKGPVALKWI
ncbi:unnamed protein product [Tuber aestivum]|uniref:Uncharacterized protein n=1 Tax=Tuber aestivum TaxID=59557 RepID=A0A292Q1F4_9PEZI|nr:unnamed protein product [Tuber aestivum]